MMQTCCCRNVLWTKELEWNNIMMSSYLSFTVSQHLSSFSSFSGATVIENCQRIGSSAPAIGVTAFSGCMFFLTRCNLLTISFDMRFTSVLTSLGSSSPAAIFTGISIIFLFFPGYLTVVNDSQSKSKNVSSSLLTLYAVVASWTVVSFPNYCVNVHLTLALTWFWFLLLLFTSSSMSNPSLSSSVRMWYSWCDLVTASVVDFLS